MIEHRRKFGLWWLTRYWMARGLISLGLFLMPDCRYKRELLIELYNMRTRLIVRLAGWTEP